MEEDMEKNNLYKEIILLLTASILTSYSITFYFITVLTVKSDSKISAVAMLAFIGIFVVLDLAALAFLLFNIIKDKKKQKEQIGMLVQNIDSQNKEEMEEKISKTKMDFLVKTCQKTRFSLNNIIGFNDLILSKSNLDNEVLENASKIRDSGIDFIEAMNDILDFSRIKYEKVELVSTEYTMSVLIKSILSSSVINTESKLIKFNLNIDEKMPNNLIGDEFVIKQIFNNLFYNAFKYTKSGKVEWEIGFECKNKDIWIISKITDSGIGIETEALEELSSKELELEKIDKISLKLAIAKEIAKKMDGSMEIESEYGKGTSVTVKIKQQIQDETPIGEKIANVLKNFNVSKNEDNSRPTYNKMPYANILIVDDMVSNLEVARGLMQPYEMNIDVVSNGRIALAKIINQSIKYSAIFLDYMMPEMNGIETLRKIRELGNDYAKNIPAIALTANTLVDSEKMFLDNGFNDFLGKPIDIMKLDAILKKWVRDKNKEAGTLGR
jgi:signal transduction histidine kinase